MGKLEPAAFCRRGHDLRKPGAVYVQEWNGETRRICRECRLASLKAYRRRQSEGIGTRKPLTEEHRARVSEGLRAYHARKRAERGAKPAKGDAEQAGGDA